MHLLLGNSEQLLTNFIEVLAQDACADRGLVRTTAVRTVEALILEGLTGRFDLAIVVPRNLIPDGASIRIYNPFSEAAQAVRILKKRSAMPIVAAATLEDDSAEARILWEAGVDGLMGLPFHPQQFASTIHQALGRRGPRELNKTLKISQWLRDEASARTARASC